MKLMKREPWVTLDYLVKFIERAVETTRRGVRGPDAKFRKMQRSRFQDAANKRGTFPLVRRPVPGGVARCLTANHTAGHGENSNHAVKLFPEPDVTAPRDLIMHAFLAQSHRDVSIWRSPIWYVVAARRSTGALCRVSRNCCIRTQQRGRWGSISEMRRGANDT